MKEKIVFGIGIIAIVLVSALIISGNNQCNDDQAKAIAASTDMLIQQKDVAIAKLFTQLKSKDAALVMAKAKLGEAESRLDTNNAILEGAKEKLDIIKAEASAPIKVKVSTEK
jgi:hypothetical protein